jgi:hypothetical protein
MPRPATTHEGAGYWPLEGCEQLLSQRTPESRGAGASNDSNDSNDDAVSTRWERLPRVRPRQINGDHGSGIIDRCTETLGLDDTGEVNARDLDSELDALDLLSGTGASHAELARAVERARHHGCSWRLIAITLGVTPEQARGRFR